MGAIFPKEDFERSLRDFASVDFDGGEMQKQEKSQHAIYAEIERESEYCKIRILTEIRELKRAIKRASIFNKKITIPPEFVEANEIFNEILRYDDILEDLEEGVCLSEVNVRLL